MVNHCGLSIFNGWWGCNFTDSLVRTVYNKLGLFHNSFGMLIHGWVILTKSTKLSSSYFWVKKNIYFLLIANIWYEQKWLLQIVYYNFTDAFEVAKKENRLVHHILLWGALDDQSCWGSGRTLRETALESTPVLALLNESFVSSWSLVADLKVSAPAGRLVQIVSCRFSSKKNM